MFVTIMDVDFNNDDHVDDIYAEERLSPGQSIPEVRDCNGDIVSHPPYNSFSFFHSVTHSFLLHTPSLLQRECVGYHSHSHITFSSSIYCNSNFYGSECTTYCVSTNNNQGHYTCDSTTGQKICLQGWDNPGNDCLTRTYMYLSAV